MASIFQPPPTYALPVVVDEITGRSIFNPIWLRWFLDLSKGLNAGGGPAGAIYGPPTSVSGHVVLWDNTTGTLLKDGGALGSAAYQNSSAFQPAGSYAPATVGTAILYGDGLGGFSSVTIGTGVSFVAGTLSATGSGGTVTSVGATTPLTSSGGATPSIGMVNQGTVTTVLHGNAAGNPAFSAVTALDAPDLLPKALTNTHIFVGNASNIATDVALSGDAVISNTGVLGVNKTRLNVRNETGSTIASTRAVYINGFNNFPLIALADNTNENKHNVIGLTIAPIAHQANGYIATSGQCDAETNAWVVGTELYFSTGGTLVPAEPTSGEVKHVGIVTVQQNYPAGKILLYQQFEGDLRGVGVGANIIDRLGDSAGATKISWRNYANTEVGYVNSLGEIKATSVSTGVPVTKTANFTLGASESWVINNKSSACVVTLPSAASYPGRSVTFQNYQAFTLTSASSNVVPQGGGAAGTAILLGVVGNWATLVSDATNWVIMQAAPNNILLLE